MTKTLDLAPGLVLPIDAATQRLAFLGKPGSGKSYAAMKLAESLYDVGAQFVALDPVGIWYGLRLAGAGEGLPIPVFGGLHGDVPLTPTSGAMIADLVVDRRLSCVLDTSQFEHDTDKARFAAGFASRFFFRMKAAPAAVHLFLEECQEWVPQNPQRGEEKMLHDFTRIDKLGRNFGIGVSLISQRPQEVNKKVLNLTECLFAFQMTGAHERKAIKEWVVNVGADENILTVLPTLAVAHAHVYSPQWLRINETVKIGKKRTADVSSTPAVGASKVVERPLTPVDLGKIREAMAASIEKAKADDPAELRREIVSLRKQLAMGATKTVEKPVVDEKAVARAVAAAVKPYMTMIEKIRRHAGNAITAGRGIVNLTEGVDSIAAQTPPLSTVHAMQPSTTVPQAQLRRIVAPSHEGVSGVEQRVLNTIAGMEQMGVPQPDKATVGAMNGYSNIRSKSFMNAIGALRSAGYVSYPSEGRIALTDVGRAIADNALPVSSHAELHELWYGLLGGVAKKILSQLVAKYPDHLTVEAVANAAGYENARSKSFANMKGRLRTLGLIDYPAPGLIAASALLFPAGLL